MRILGNIQNSIFCRKIDVTVAGRGLKTPGVGSILRILNNDLNKVPTTSTFQLETYILLYMIFVKIRVLFRVIKVSSE